MANDTTVPERKVLAHEQILQVPLGVGLKLNPNFWID
ncbi:hypothetical protein FHW72_002345 [Ochrobactrum sp. RC6B]|nr:hypothetical protein [Ochrobactrum sp. RC6B]